MIVLQLLHRDGGRKQGRIEVKHVRKKAITGRVFGLVDGDQFYFEIQCCIWWDLRGETACTICLEILRVCSGTERMGRTYIIRGASEDCFLAY